MLIVFKLKDKMNTNFLIQLTCVAVLSEIVYQVYKRVKSKQSTSSLTYSLMKIYDNKVSEQFHKVIFFPDPGVLCRRVASGRQCRDTSCRAEHGDTSLIVLLNVIRLTKRKLNVCVYMITYKTLGDALIECLERGVQVKVITEKRNSGEEGEMAGSQIGNLRKAGVPCICISSSFWMHHKFLVADDEVLVNGSFNWTNQATMGNLENLLITSEKRLVEPFIIEFQKLWDEHAGTEIENK